MPTRFTPEIREVFMQRLAKEFPNPESELEHRSPYELLVAVMLSAQMTDKGVNLATRKLFAAANTPQAVAELGVEGLIPYIRTVNYYRTKAEHVVAASRALIEEHGGEVPADFDALVKLPGVGRKTANVVLNVAFGMSTIPVDTHIFRVSNRTGFAPGGKPAAVEKKLLEVVPEHWKHDAHHLLLLFGRYICKARSPECERCPVAEFCSAPEKAARLADAIPGAPSLDPEPQASKPRRRTKAQK